jgi:DNA polymerase
VPPATPIEPTERFLPPRRDLESLARAARACRGCGLYRNATQAVFGEGPQRARVFAIGEQPGDVEDRKGRPFVGPAGRVLDRALAEAGIDRAAVYVTNAVKHFSFEERGRRRIHKKPRLSEIQACKPWLEAELAAVQPDVVLLLGASAALSVLGPSFRVSKQRGQLMESPLAPVVLATVHPSSILRAADDAARELAFAGLVRDLRLVADALRRLPPARELRRA